LGGFFEQVQAKDDFSWLTLSQLVFSLLVAFGLFAASLFFILIGFGQISSQVPGMPDPVSTYLYAGSLAFAGLLLLPSAGYALQRLVRGEKPRPQYEFSGRWLLVASVLLVILMPLVLLVGDMISKNGRIAWFFLPFLHILAVVIPIFWLAALGLNGLTPLSRQRVWGLFGAGLALGPMLILFLELALLAGFFVLAIVFVASRPALAKELTNLVQRFRYAPYNPDSINQVAKFFISNPAVVATAFAYIAVFVPLIEETLKPIGVWLLAGRRLTPIEGFMAGLLSGAGYALFENLFLSSAGEQWVSLVLARVGTGAVHMFTTSLVGWGLASAWGQGRHLRLGLSFAAAVSVHSLWNGLTLLTLGTQVSPLSEMRFTQPPGYLLPFGLVCLAFLCILMIWVFNRAMKRAIIALPPLAAQETEPMIESNEV
jgi:hypothetical protein